jgi:hypothetical protein
MHYTFDKLHNEVENKLLRLITSLELKRGTGEWAESLPQQSANHPSVNPLIQQSNNPPIQPSYDYTR